METCNKDSLYNKLGGVRSIAAVIDNFTDRVYSNEIVNANSRTKEARKNMTKAGFMFQLTSLVCNVTGGPQKYIGRSMKDAHKNLLITEKEWDSMVLDFKAALNTFKVPEPEQNELFTIVGGVKSDVVS